MGVEQSLGRKGKRVVVLHLASCYSTSLSLIGSRTESDDLDVSIGAAPSNVIISGFFLVAYKCGLTSLLAIG